MNEEQFNIELRKFLKQFGVTAQREIERAVREGLAQGTLPADQPVVVHAKLEVAGTEVMVLTDKLVIA